MAHLSTVSCHTYAHRCACVRACVHAHALCTHIHRVGQNHIWLWPEPYIYGVIRYFGREITSTYTAIYGTYIRFWPTLHMHAHLSMQEMMTGQYRSVCTLVTQSLCTSLRCTNAHTEHAYLPCMCSVFACHLYALTHAFARSIRSHSAEIMVKQCRGVLSLVKPLFVNEGAGAQSNPVR